MRLLFLCFLIASFQASGQVTIKVHDHAPVTITADQFRQLPQHAAVLQDHGKQVEFRGVPLHDLLVKGGVDFGKGLHGTELSSYVLALAEDGYQAVFALADFDPALTDTGIIVANQREGHSLSAKEGPLRIVCPRDKRPARSVRMLRELDIVQLKH